MREVDWKINVFNDKQLDVVLIVDKRRNFRPGDL